MRSESRATNSRTFVWTVPGTPPTWWQKFSAAGLSPFPGMIRNPIWLWKNRVPEGESMRNTEKLRSSASYPTVLLVCMIALGLLPVAAQKKVAAGSLFSPEKGKFNILLDGKSVGHEDFEIAASGGGWMAHGTTSMKPPQ